MAEPSLAVIVTRGERAVCHTVDPGLPAGELAGALTLYLGAAPAAAVLVWRSESGPRALDPSLPLGEQIPPDAEIDITVPA